MRSLKNISLEKEEQTAILVFDNPPVNSLSLAVLDDLETVLHQIQDDKTIKVVLLKSRSPKFFAAGGDIKEIAAIGSAQEGREYAERGKAILDKIETANKPFLAVVEGACLGGGCELAMACHIRIAGSTATFGLPEISLGIMPGFGGTQRLARLVGPGKALELMLTGEKISANQAQAIGLADRVIEKGSVYDAALALAKQIQTKPALAIAAILSTTLNRNSTVEGFKKETRMFGELCETNDKQEGTNAFLEKRPPRFQDR